ncbi:MAG: carboxymuconolactone decarboxylase family protein [Hyphomicrobium sp.]|nr:carboxymuconolactone decarboxylase family protein [Hyphomicrobium sp.]
MKTITVPAYNQVNIANREIFDKLKNTLGFVPNLFATFAHSETALETYLTLQNAKSSLSAKAREVINLVVSEVNQCEYCLAAHTVMGKMNGLTDAQIAEIRGGRASFEPRLDALAQLVKGVAAKRGHPDPQLVQAFFKAGWTEANLVDAIVVIGDKTISNYLHGVTRVPVDFPAAPALTAELALI